jgi:TorA maturation chaperone TorD
VSDVRALLEQSAMYRVLSLVFQPPRPETGKELYALAVVVPGALGEDLAKLAGHAVNEATYHALLGSSGICPDCESDYEVNALGGKGPLLADVSGFYQAFRFDPTWELRLPPDHIAAELGFLGYLALKEASASARGLEYQAGTCRDAAATFVRDHLGRWASAFCERLQAAGERGAYENAACLLLRMVAHG